ncbi:MAG: PEGA domain-containing protein, partial [Planctomycetes bacterium]|nr:PEGA domain-containing protein [Planctomycetota bacterium]
MIRPMFILYALSGAMAVSAALAEETKTVKPSSVETRKEADTQVFVTTAPEGAKVIIDGKDVGS